MGGQGVLEGKSRGGQGAWLRVGLLKGWEGFTKGMGRVY